jgi:hypothetical protein
LIARIYTPILYGDVEEGGKQNLQLKNLIYSLRAGLERTLRKGSTTLMHKDFDVKEFRGILTPMDEIDVWLEVERENYASQ